MGADEWDDVRRVLAVRLDNIGDVILLGPALHSLKAHLPSVEVTLLASPAGAQVASLLPDVDDVIAYRAQWQATGVPEPADVAQRQLQDLIGTLSERDFDAALIFTSFSQSPHPPALACYLAGIPRRIGQSKEFGGALLTHWVTPLDDWVHQADRNLYLLETAGIPPVDTRLRLDVPEDAQSSIVLKLEGLGIAGGDRIIVAVPGASCPARRYDPGRFGRAVEQVAEKSGIRVVVAGSGHERWMADLATRRSDKVVSLSGETSVPEFVALIERADAVLAANSSALHIADAFLRPVVVLYSGAEDIEQWRPRHSPSILLNRYAECATCHRFTCPYDMRCLDIPVEDVVESTLSLLAGQTSTAEATLPRTAASADSLAHERSTSRDGVLEAV